LWKSKKRKKKKKKGEKTMRRGEEKRETLYFSLPLIRNGTGGKRGPGGP